MSKKTATLVTFLLDRSGSMDSIKDATIEAFNAYLDGLKKGKTKIDFTFLQFDTMSLDKVCVSEPIKSVVHLTDKTFVPRGGTPLIDSAFKTIKAVEAALPKRDDKPKIVICIQTDGEENSSREHTWDELQDLIKAKTKLGWQFIFMGASIDAYAQGVKMGIAHANTMSYDSKDLAATRSAFASTASNNVNYASGLRETMAYSGAQKHAAGDIYDKKLPPATPRFFAKHKGAKALIVDDLDLS